MSTPTQPSTQPAQPPVAPRRPTSREIHGRTRTDDYEWLREKESPEVLAHLEAENAWTQARTAHLADLRATIFEEIRTRTRETDLSVPTRNRGHWYYGRSFAGKEYGATCRVPVADPDDWTPPRPAEDCAPDQPALPGEEVLLDLDALAEGHDFFSLGGAAVSPDGTLLAYATDVVGDERYTVRVKDLRTGDLLPDVVEGVIGGATWDRAGEHLYYVTVDESWRADKVWRHALGTDQDVGVDDGVAPCAPTPRAQWRPLIGHDTAVRLEDVDAFATHLVVHQRSEGLTQLRILELGGTQDAPVTDDYLVSFDEEVYTVGASGNPGFHQPTVRLGYTTMAIPSSIYDYDVRDRSLTLLRRAPVLGGYDPADYEEHRLWATAEDGERIPISWVARRGAVADGPAPTLLYAYGSYEASMDPYFSIARLSLLDRGAAFAIAHVRGGGEMGRRWYDDGKLMRKQHTFSDFAACARHLVDIGWASPDTLVGEGASAGGLLIGAVANRAPELFSGLVAGVPFVDALTTMLDSTLPLTVTEYDEWGNPEADPAVYDYMASYAPYDNVTEQDYPAILAETSLNDTRVLYVEPAKWVAKLRATAPDHRPDVLLRTEMAAGHGGVSGRYKSWHDRSFTLAWMLDRMGLAGS